MTVLSFEHSDRQAPVKQSTPVGHLTLAAPSALTLTNPLRGPAAFKAGATLTGSLAQRKRWLPKAALPRPPSLIKPINPSITNKPTIHESPTNQPNQSLTCTGELRTREPCPCPAASNQTTCVRMHQQALTCQGSSCALSPSSGPAPHELHGLCGHPKHWYHSTDPHRTATCRMVAWKQ
jgi:hypothetical protein